MIIQQYSDLFTDSPLQAIIALADKLSRLEARNTDIDSYYSHFAALAKAMELSKLPIQSDSPKLTGTEGDKAVLHNWSQDVRSKARLLSISQMMSSAEDHLNERMSSVPNYKFSQKDKKTIQEYINELRTLISETEELEEKHRLRLLKRLEKMQQELSKPSANMDIFVGFAADAGTALALFTENAKPFFDRAESILKIVSRVKNRSEGLPESAPRLHLPNTSRQEGPEE